MLIYAALEGDDPIMLVNAIDYLKRKGHLDDFAIGGYISKRLNYHKKNDIIHVIRKHIGDPAFITKGAKRLLFEPGSGSAEFSDIPKTTYLPCICSICSFHTYDEIRSERRLIAMHNLWMTAHETRKLKTALKENEIEQYPEERFLNNPAIMDAFRYAKTKRRGMI